MRREWERLCERGRAVGQITGCSHRFHEANIKATAGGKGQAETHEDSCRKGMRNAIYVIERQHVCVCVSMYMQQQHALCLFNFKGNFLWADILYSSKTSGWIQKPSDWERLKKCKPHQRAALWIHMKEFFLTLDSSGLDVNPVVELCPLLEERKCFAFTVYTNTFLSDRGRMFLFNLLYTSHHVVCYRWVIYLFILDRFVRGR